MDKDYQETITNLVCECKLLEQQLKKKDEIIENIKYYVENNGKEMSEDATYDLLQILEDKEVE